MNKSIYSIRFVTALLVIMGLGITGCAELGWQRPVQPTSTQDVDLVSESYAAADSLFDQAPYLREDSQPLITASFVDVNDLKNSSSLGRIIAEQISSRFSQQGFTMIEMKLRNEVFIQERAGEFVLSRSVKDISQAHDAAAVVAGTYAVGRRSVYVSARLIRAADNLILAAVDYNLPLGPDTRALLANH